MGKRGRGKAGRQTCRPDKARQKKGTRKPRLKRSKLPAGKPRKTTESCADPPAPVPQPEGIMADHLRRAQHAQACMAQHPGWNAEQIAQHLNYSPHTLGLAYKAVTGTTLQAALIENCHQHAARLLATAIQLNISQISVACGYTHQANFTRAFKTRFGKSPRQYRRSIGDGVPPRRHRNMK